MERQTTPPNEGAPGGFDPLDDPLGGSYREPPPPRGGPGMDPATALFVLIDALRRVVPRELEGQMTNVIREFLLTLRSLIDWYLERLDRPKREPRVEDIPID
jgi:hypothetical protein